MKWQTVFLVPIAALLIVSTAFVLPFAYDTYGPGDPIPNSQNPLETETPTPTTVYADITPTPRPASSERLSERVESRNTVKGVALYDTDDPGPHTRQFAGDTLNSTRIEMYLLQRINALRSEKDLDNLSQHDFPASVARAHSEDMATSDFFAHENPDGEGPWDRAKDITDGDACYAYGENIVALKVEPASESENINKAAANVLYTGWLNSPPHYDLMTGSTWDVGGLGVYLPQSDSVRYQEGEYIRVYATLNVCNN